MSSLRAGSLLEAPVTEVPGVSARVATVLRTAFEIRTVRDLLEHYPNPDRYHDLGAPRLALDGVTLGEQVTLVGVIEAWNVIRPRGRRMTIAKATVLDDEGRRVEVPFFNQEWRARSQPPGTRAAFSGTLEQFRRQLQLRNPKMTVLRPGQTVDDDVDRIQATYPATEALPSHRIAKLVTAALEELPPLSDPLPTELRDRHGLPDLDSALRTIHRPTHLSSVGAARNRLVYDELLCLQLGLQRRRHRLESEVAGLPQPPGTEGLADLFRWQLPFTPTNAQTRALAEIGADLGRGKPMHRLLQGDVGSGKTLVAVWAMLVALDHGHQAMLMAPTEVLAEQHLRTLTALLAPMGVNAPGGPRLELVTGTTPAKALRRVLADIASGDVQLIIGTHALLEDRVRPVDLGVVVVDEQHRFGVEHRTRLRAKRSDDRHPDVLVMTATPIPRSLALTLYGDLDVTVLDELPPGRQEVRTEVLPTDSPRRERLYGFVRERVAAGERCYVVCPLIAESEALEHVAAATDVHRWLSHEVFPDLTVGLVHGRLAASERDTVMEGFRDGTTPILVATTVIEVGVDVPEATVMIVEDADRFGISQLHQLRGRVGRGSARSYCVLFSSSAEPNPRLAAMAETSSGFALADVDLALRGEGSLFDTRQSGLPDLKLAKLIRDIDWIVRSRQDARELIDADSELDGYPALREEVRRRYGDERLAALETG